MQYICRLFYWLKYHRIVIIFNSDVTTLDQKFETTFEKKEWFLRRQFFQAMPKIRVNISLKYNKNNKNDGTT